MRRPKPKRERPTISPFLSLLCAGEFITAHDVTSGEYRTACPTGWSHATFRLEANRFYMKGQDGHPDWCFARLLPSGRLRQMPRPGGIRAFAEYERKKAAVAVIRYAYGTNKTLPANIEVKAPTGCQRPGCTRTLSAGRSLTLRSHPTFGIGFFGPDCFKHDNPEANKRKAGLDAMTQLLASTAPVKHINNCPCPQCKGNN